MNSLPFGQLKSFLKILIGVQYEAVLFQNAFSRKERKTMDRRIRLTALMLAASLLLNMVVLPVHGQEDTAPSAAQVSQENEPAEEPTEEPTETVPAPPQTTAPSATEQTQAPTVPEETTQAAETTEPTVQTEPTQATQETTEPEETEPGLSLLAEPEIPPKKEGNTYEIYSYEQLVSLSTMVAASEYADSTIKIYGRSGSPESMKEFKGLGDAGNPFRGTLVFGSDTEANLTLYTAPLFNYLSTQAKFEWDSTVNGGYLQLTDKSQEGALLAGVLVNDGGNPEWKIIAYNLENVSGEDTQLYAVPIIGTMRSGCSVTLSVKDGYRFPVKAADAGLLCGAMEENAQLTLEHYEQITAKQTEYFIKATSGAAGGLVGKMGKNAALTVKPSLSFPEKTIQAAGGAGDLVGEMGENATLTVSGSLTCAGKIDAGGSGGSLVGQMGKNTQVTVTGDLTLNVTEVTSGGSAGGLVGRMAEGSALSLPGSEELTVQTNLSGSNVGGLVGEMKDGARLSGLSGTAKVTVSGTVTATQNAGGLIGLGENLVLDGGMPEVTATKITGSSTAGGLIGSYTYSKTGAYYNGSTDYPSVNVNLSDSGGNVGGLYGYVKNTAGDFHLKGDKTVTVTAAKGNSLGGLMGRYEANSLTAQSLYVNAGTVSLSGNGGDSYGGIIGSVYGNNGVYIEVQKAAPTCTANNNAASNVGGLIGKLDGGGHMLRLSGVTASGLPGNSASGGLVGYMQKGVLYLGKDITITKPGSGGKNGWVLGDRDNTLVYTDQNWNPRKGTTNDIGGWGQVVRSDNLPGVLTYDATKRAVTVAAPHGSEGTYAVGNAAEFAALALRYQLDETNSLKFANGDANLNAAQTVNLTADVNYLENIGITGFQRDVSNTAAVSVTLNGNGHTVTLPDIPVYTGGNNHDRQGLFTKTTNLTASNVTVNGKITAHAGSALYIGALCAETTGTATLEKVTGNTETLVDAEPNNTYGIWDGRIAGILATSPNASFTDCEWTGSIVESTKSDCALGGFYARNNERQDTTIFVKNGRISGKIQKTESKDNAIVGGLAASLRDNGTHKLTIDGLTVDGLTITTNANVASGGLLGYEWPNTTATITGVSVKNSTLNAGPNARFGGLVYTGSGYWRVEKGTATAGIHFVSGNSFTGKSEQSAPSGLIVAKGEKNGNTALYLEIREDAYKAEGTTVNIGGSQYFDEIVGSNQSANNNGIVSIALPGHALIDRTGCNTYQSQLGGTWVNGKTRYYYNLDAYRDALGYDAKTGTIGESPNLGTVDTAPKLMLWNAYHDSENGLRKYFSKQTGGFVISGEIDLGGYSFYPTPFINDTTIQNASITFDYDTMNGFETGASNKPLGQSTSQHYQMHTGIFNGGKATDKDQNLNVNGLKLSGTVGRSATGTGALCCGPFTGSSIYARMYLTIQNVDLAGIRVSSGSAEKPLLIYSLGSYSTLDMNGVKTSTGYEDLNTDGTKYAASSLIGRVGGNTGKEIRLTFRKMCLDGRPGRNNAVQYGTTGCIFSRALFLESFDYVEASSGVYNFTEAEKNACTLGRELSNSTDGPVSGRNNDEQRWYYGGKLEGKLVSGSADGWNSFYQNYTRYVYQSENLTASGSTQHELDVNLNTTGLEIGCGTRTDPYIITEFSQLKTLNLVLRDGTAENWPVYLDTEVLANVQKKQSFADTDEHTRTNVNGGHVSYTYSPEDGLWKAENGTTVEPAVMRLYLQNAHYQLEKDITADNSWDGLGHADSTGQTGSQIIAFGGEIDGAGHTFTIPGSTASQFGGLVKYSMGSVVRNITVEYTGSISLSCTAPPSSEISPSFFGGVVGYAFGGDTILDGVTVTIANPPETKDKCSYLAAVGGYVGLVGGAFSGASHSGKNKYGGGVVFRGTIGPGLTGGKAAETSGQFYYNPYVGRVLDGYVLGDGVSLDNTNKNYQIPNISSRDAVNSHLAISRSGNKVTATVKDAEGLWLLSAIANSGAAAMNGYEAYSFSRPRIGSYAMTDITAARKDDTCLGGVSLTAKTASQCYLSKYVSGDFSRLATTSGFLLTIQFTADCDMTDYGNGFRGIGGSYVCINVGTPNDYTRQLHIQTVDGKISDDKRAVITLNQQRNEYVAEKNNWTVSGSGLFLAVRNATDSTFSNLILSGNTGITYFDDKGKPCQAGSILDSSNTLWAPQKRANMAAAGMLISSFCAHRTNAVILNRVTLQNASVNGDSLGCTTAGGFIGMIGFNTQFKNEARFIDCTYENLTVRALIMAGGFAGYSAATKVTVSNTQDVELTDGDIRATAPFCMNVEDGRQDAGGLFGHIHRYDDSTGTLEINPEGNAVMTIRNLKVTGTVTWTDNTTVGGLVGYESVAKGQTVTVKGVRLEGTVELIGGENAGVRTNVGGLFGYLSDVNANHWQGTRDAAYHLSVSDVKIGGEPGSAVRMANGRQLGGLIGLMKNPGGQMTIDGVSVGSESGTVQILAGSNGSSDCITGGLLGVVCLYPSMTLSNIRLNHAAIIGKRASGGAVGQVENQSRSTDAAYVPKIQLENLSMENSDIAACNSRSSVGGLYGYLSGCTANLTGYNILLKDNRIGYLLNDSQNGYRGSVPSDWSESLPIGLINGKSENTGIFGGQRSPWDGHSYTLKFTGVSLVQAKNTVPTQDFGTALSTGDYLVRSDYTGVQEETTLSAYPHVTTNPISPLTALLGQNVTGDGACFTGTTPIGEKIRSESGSKENRNLTHTAVEEARKYLTDTETNRPSDMAYFGSFTGDGDNGDYSGGNFPVFVISTTSTDEANRALYSALSLLTNRVMYGKTITNDLDPAPPADMKLSLTNYVYSGGTWQVSQEDGSFTLDEATKRIRLNGQYDNQRARFTLLRADFANPADATETVYTLYLPILVKKVFNFRFWASALTGTSYIQSNYDDLNRLAIASDNEKVTALLGFDYTRTREEWQKAVNDGENLLWNFLKQLRLSVRLPDDTRLVLVDRNNQDKAWYATASQALQQVDSYYELKFTGFQDQAGANWAPVTLSQLLPLTARALTEAEKADETLTGKFVIAADKTQATVQIGDTYYRKATDEDKNQTQYAITVGELNGELSERYYLTLQTPANSQQLLNILLTCGDRLTNPVGNGLPTKRLPASDRNPNNGFARNGDENRIVIASCFSQTVSLTTAESQLEMISDSNTQVKAGMTATIRFKDAESARQFQNYAGDQKLSQCFNLVFYRYEDGTKTQVNLTPGTQITAVYRYGEDTWTEHYIVDTATRSYRLTFPKEIPCSDIQAHAVELTAELTLDFASSYVDQFPIRQRENEGILMAVTSTLSYTPQTLTSSTLSTQPPSEDTRYRHFYRGEVSVASLNYDAVGDTEMDSINQLGINGFEGNSAELRSAASYNVSAVSRAENARYLRCTLTLSPRNNTGTQPFVSYGAAVPWGKCLTGEKMKLSLRYTDSKEEVIEADNPTNTENNVNATYTATFRLDKVLDKNVPLEISADMFLLAGAALEANGMTYANYKIRLEAELLDENQNAISGSNASDYLVYTNSRIYKNIIPRT